MSSFERKHPSTRSPAKRRRRRKSGSESRTQIVLGWVALLVVFAATLRNGGTHPLAWHLLCLTTFVLFAMQVVLDLWHGLPRQARKALWVALPWFTVLAWLQVQSLAGLAPALAHPFWAIAPDGASPTISAHPDAGRQVVMRLTCYAMLFWIFLRFAGSRSRDGVAFIQAIAIFSTALAIYGMVSKATGYNVLLDADETARQLRASFWYRNAYATFAVFGVLANITAYVRSVSGNGNRDGRYALRDYLEAFFAGGWIFAFGALVGLVAIAMTQSRAGAMAGVVGVVVLVWALRRGSGKVHLALLAVPVALAVFVGLFMTSGVVSRLDRIDDDARLGVFRQVVAGVIDRPLLGHGAGAFPEAFRPYVALEQAAFDWNKAHNTYLENAFEFGLPAAALFFFALAMIGRRLVSGVLTRKRNQSTPAFALACFAAAAFHSLFDFSLQIPAIAALFAAILGIGWAQSFPTRRVTKIVQRRPRVDDL